MITTLRGLAVLAALAVALAAALLVLDRSEPASGGDRQLVPDAAARFERLVLAPAGRSSLTVSKLPHERWYVTGSDGKRAHADESTIDALRAALRGGRWHRRAAPSAAEPLRGELQIGDGADVVRIGIGRELPGADQSWVVARGQALLVDGWVARALWPDALALRVRHPLADAAGAYSISDGEVVLRGRHQLRPTERWINESAYAAVTASLAELAIVSLDGMKTGPRGRTISVSTSSADGTAVDVTEAGTCEGDRVLVTTTVGDGCVERAAWTAAIAAFDPLRLAGSESVVDTRPAPFHVGGIQFATGESLALAGTPRIDRDIVLDPERVNELVAALATSATIVQRPAGPPRTTIEVRDGNTNTAGVTLEIYATVVARTGESFALRPTPDALAILARPPKALHDRVRWREDPITLTSFELDGVTYSRGAVIGEWSRTPPGEVDAALVDAVVDTVATLKGPRGSTAARIAHTLTVHFTPPAGEPRTHTLELGVPAPTACAARVDGEPVQLDAVDVPLCAAVAALATSR